jgi:hypothetical protein
VPPPPWRRFGRIKLTCALLIETAIPVTPTSDDQEKAAPQVPSKKPSYVVDTFPEDLAAGSGGLAIDQEGFVYCADFGTQLGAGPPAARIYKLDPKTGKATVFAEGLHGASAIASVRIGRYSNPTSPADTSARSHPRAKEACS